ncbi:hypothetical protein MNBD_CHLOROFLEXI01-4294, partial [hydrothermal vent metagenome]
MMNSNLFPLKKKRIAAYTAVLFLLFISRFVLNSSNWVGSATLHMVMEFLSASFALFVGTLSMARFYTRQNSAYFFIGVGFIGAGLLDIYHAMFIATLGLGELTAVSLQIWRRNPSSTFLSIFIMGSWLIWQRTKRLGEQTTRYYLIAALLAFISLIIFVLIPQPPLSSSLYLPGRAMALVAATFFLIALIGYIRKQAWQQEPFDHWLVIALIINVGAQALFLFFARVPFDALFFTAVLLKLIGYVCLLIGLLTSVYTIFKKAELVANSQLHANEALQREVAERKRAEAAEQEQRNLAEALRQVGLALNSTLNFDELLDKLLDQIGLVLRYDTANIMLVHRDEIEIVVTRGYDPTKVLRQPRHFPVESRPSLIKMSKTAEPLIIPDTFEAGDLWVDPELSLHVRSWAGAPIIVEGEVVA